MLPSKQILTETAAYFNAARKNLIAGAEGLYRIKSENLWESHFSSFSEYVQSECQIGLSMASKLVSLYEHYAIQNKISPKQLEGIDHEKLYLAIKLPMETEGKLLRAQTWTRADIKAELAVIEGEECKHPNPITICGTCHKRLN